MLTELQRATIPGGDDTHDELRDCCARLALHNAELHGVLKVLLDLKNQKDAAEKDANEARAMGACPSMRTARLLRDYEERKPKAWEAARSIVTPNV